ncbi:MAG: leucine-rich repeat domain-containing protein [Lachnospiraceae bacterium]|nr:leucine-rich repeat domain-containing protein [Lachnospiraceae bacterium]
MDKKDFESLLNKYPDCVSNGKKLKAFLTDLYPDVPKAIVNTLTIMADDGIISEMQKVGQTPLVSARLQKKLEDDYGLSQKIISKCFSLIIYDNVKQTKSTINAGTYEKITSFIDTQPTFELRKEGPQKLDILQPEYNPKDFEIENGTLKKYKGSSSVVVIPNSVTSIGERAFSYCTWLTSIIIPNSVTSIGKEAFYNCSGLTSITIPNSVTSIGSSAFSGCNKLQDIYITDIAAWCNISGLYSLMGCGTSNKNLYLNNELVTSITIPNGATVIPGYAFKGCSSLTSITIPDSVTSIGDFAFYNCYRLIEVYNKSTLSITAGSSSNGEVAYYAKNVYTTEGGSKLTTDENGYVIYTDEDEKILVAYTGTETNLTLPSGITQIKSNAFSRCTSLTSITIGNNVTSIGECAFMGCDGLTSITIPDSVTSIGDSAFEKCTGFTSITIPNSVTSIGMGAFYNCTGLTSITIPNSVTSIGDSAFNGCSGLTSVTIPDSVTSIGDSAFWGCSGLTSVTIGNSVTSICNSAFINCTGLTSVAIGNSVMSIGSSAFESCRGLISVTIPDSVTSIGASAFWGCSGLTSVTVPDSVTKIGGGAFYNCSKLQDIYITDIAAWCNILGLDNLMYYNSCNKKKLYINNEPATSITIPDGVTAIPSSAFSWCSSLTSVTIGGSVTSIGDWAFSSCTGLTSITISDSVTSIGKFAFYNCNKFQDIYITDIAAWCNISGLDNLMRKGASNKNLYINNEPATSITIPDGVTAIQSSAFKGCTGLTSVTIPDSVTSIGDDAFSCCRNLTIYCEAESKPIGWSSYWNPEHRPVVWGVKK